MGGDRCLRQGEILSNVVQVHIEQSSLETRPLLLSEKTHPYAVILSQWCDLDSDHRARNSSDASENEGSKSRNQIPTVLFCEVHTASELKTAVPKGSEIWRRIQQNNDERYHFLERVAPELDAEGLGLEEMGIDFKRFFAIPTDEVYHRLKVGQARRRCCLASPYLEHFCRRFANHLSRIALPVPHVSC